MEAKQMNVQTALELLVNIAHHAQKSGILTLDDAFYAAQAVAMFSVKKAPEAPTEPVQEEVATTETETADNVLPLQVSPVESDATT